MFCSKCGSENKDGSNFCIKCGAPIEHMEENILKNEEPGIVDVSISWKVVVVVVVVIIFGIILGAVILGKNDNQQSSGNKQQDKYEEFVDSERLRKSQEYYQTAEQFLESGEYLAARDYYLMVIPEDSNYANACKKAQQSYDMYIQDVKEQLESVIAKNDFIQAVQFCKSQEEYFEGEDKTWLMQKEDDLKEDCLNHVINSTEIYLDVKEIGLAEKCVNIGLSLYPDDEDLLELQSVVREYQPVYLGAEFMTKSDMDEERSAPYYDDRGPYYDTSGNQYDNANFYWTSEFYSKQSEKIYDTYNLNREYTHFTAVLAPESGWKDLNNGKGTTFYIVGDGTVLFQSYVDEDSNPVSIDLDITGVKELKIGMKGGNNVRIWLAEPYIYKRY